MQRQWALALVWLCSGCFLFGRGPDGDPCDDDRFGCEGDGSGFEIDPTCELEGELMVMVGAGEDGFEPLSEGESPPVIWGSQGGQHTVLGVRVENPALDRYDRLRVELGLFNASQCPAPEDDALIEPCAGDPPGGARVLVLGRDMPLQETEEGWVEEHGMVMFFDAVGEADVVIQAIADDPCGRQGVARHRFSR